MGLNLSAPITTMHIERHHNPIMNAACCHVHGWRLTQEDAHNIIEDINSAGIMLFGVYDGHGGSLAAQYLQAAIPIAFQSITSLSDHQNITKLMLELDSEFVSKQHQDGTTCCIVLAQLWDAIQNVPISIPFDTYFESINYNIETLKNNTAIRLLSVNIGDSRAMVVTSSAIYSPPQAVSQAAIANTGHAPGLATPVALGGEGVKKRSHYVAITNDHKPQNETERQRIINAMGTVTGNRVDGSLALSRAIGDAPYKSDPLLPPTAQKVIAVPDFQTHTIYWGDVLLVCCDGIFEADRMTYNEVTKITARSIQSIVNTHKFIATTPISDTEKSTTSTVDNLKLGIDAFNQDLTDDLMNPEYADWDPALVARDLIEQSLLAESKDNHTAIVISFKLPRLIPQGPGQAPKITPSLLEFLPKKECIPGPYAANAERDGEWANTYLKDLSHQGYKMEDVKEVLDIVDNVISLHCNDNSPLSTAEVGTKVVEAMNTRLVKINNGDAGEQKDEEKKTRDGSVVGESALTDHNISIIAPILMKKHLFKTQNAAQQAPDHLYPLFHQILRTAQQSNKASLTEKNSGPKPF